MRGRPESSRTNESTHRPCTRASAAHTNRQQDSNDYLNQLSSDYYDRTLDRLVAEFSLNDRKRNLQRHGRRVALATNERKSNPATKSATNFDYERAWPMQHNATNGNEPCTSRSLLDGGATASANDVKDVNFWTNVFFSNGSAAVVTSNDLVKSLYSSAPTATITSTASSSAMHNGNYERRAGRRVAPPVVTSTSAASLAPTTSATYLLNSILANPKDANHSARVVVNGNGGDASATRNSTDISSTSSASFLNSMKQQNLMARRKNSTNENRHSVPNAADNFINWERDAGLTEHIEAVDRNELLQVMDYYWTLTWEHGRVILLFFLFYRQCTI